MYDSMGATYTPCELYSGKYGTSIALRLLASAETSEVGERIESRYDYNALPSEIC